MKLQIHFMSDTQLKLFEVVDNSAPCKSEQNKTNRRNKQQQNMQGVSKYYRFVLYEVSQFIFVLWARNCTMCML